MSGFLSVPSPVKKCCVYVCIHTLRERAFKRASVDKRNDTGYLGEVLGVEHRSETVDILVVSTPNACIYLKSH